MKIRKEDQKNIMEKLYAEYRENLLALVLAKNYTRVTTKSIQDAKIDYRVRTTYYTYGGAHCARREVRDCKKPYHFEYFMFEARNGAFCRVYIDQCRVNGKISKQYNFTILKDGEVKNKQYIGSDYEILRDKERQLVSDAENCFDIISRCEYAELQEIL